MAAIYIKFFITLLLTLYISHVAHTRHIRSVDDVTQQQIQQQQDDSTVPPPPSDGGAKSPIQPESPVGEIPDEPQRESTEVPPVVIEENRTKPDGKMGFGGPPASEEKDSVREGEEKEKVVPSGVEVVQQEGTVETPDGVLSSCRVCPPGSGVLQPCTSTEDTVCTPCIQGTYSEGYSATSTCRQCSVCPLSYYQKTPCVVDADVICGACHSHGNGFGNEDFLKQCEDATLPPPTTAAVTEEDRGQDAGSGELETSTLEPGLLPVKTVLPVVKETADPDVDVMAIGQPHMGEAKAKEKEQPQEAQTGKFQWPILVAAIVSGMVFFIVGILASMWCKKVAKEQKQKQDMYGEDSVRSTMIRHTNNDYSPSRGSSGYHESDQATPLNPGK